MGLDVYLYEYQGNRTPKEDFEELDNHTVSLQQIEKNTLNELFPHANGNCNNLNEQEIKSWNHECKKRKSAYLKNNEIPLKIGSFGDVIIPEEKIELDSEKYPEHLFKIGYFRSSYNRSGIDGILNMICRTNLAKIFEAKNYYLVKPDWKKAKVRCDCALDQFKAHDGICINRIPACGPEEVLQNLRNLDRPISDESESLRRYKQVQENITEITETCVCEDFMLFPQGTKLLAVIREPFSVALFEDKDGNKFSNTDSTDMEKAIAIFNQEKNRSTSSFSNRQGYFYLDGIEVFGMCIVEGMEGKCLDFVFKNDFDFYIQAMEIVKETIDWVLNQPDPDIYFFHWSA